MANLTVNRNSMLEFTGARSLNTTRTLENDLKRECRSHPVSSSLLGMVNSARPRSRAVAANGHSAGGGSHDPVPHCDAGAAAGFGSGGAVRKQDRARHARTRLGGGHRCRHGRWALSLTLGCLCTPVVECAFAPKIFWADHGRTRRIRRHRQGPRVLPRPRRFFAASETFHHRPQRRRPRNLDAGSGRRSRHPPAGSPKIGNRRARRPATHRSRRGRAACRQRAAHLLLQCRAAFG